MDDHLTDGIPRVHIALVAYLFLLAAFAWTCIETGQPILREPIAAETTH